MAMPVSDTTAAGLPDSTEAAAQQMEAAILRQLLTASGAFKPADVAGGQLRADMFVETLADAVAKGGGIGIARMLEDEIEKTGPKSGAKTGSKIGSAGEGASADLKIDGGPDDDPASFAARKPAEGTTVAHTNHDTTLYAGASQVPVKSGENGTYSGVVHRALNAYQKRAEDTVVGKLQGPRTGDAP
jgi:Rod binding domain-containing protein